MKRLFTLSAICVAMLSLVGCDSKQKAIYEWAKGEVNHFAALETEHPSLYYIKDHIGLKLIKDTQDLFTRGVYLMGGIGIVMIAANGFAGEVLLLSIS